MAEAGVESQFDVFVEIFAFEFQAPGSIGNGWDLVGFFSIPYQ